MSETPEMSIYEKTFAKSDKTDAILVVDGKKLHVNKAVLSYHSDYFKTLFNSDFKEKSMEEIEIKDVKFEDFATALSLVHSAPIKFETCVTSLLKTANRFQLSFVKRRLELYLLSSNSTRDKLIELADKFQLDELMEHALSLFKEGSHFVYNFHCYDVRRTFFNSLSDETNIKLHHRLLEIYGCYKKSPVAVETASIYEKAFTQSDKTDAILLVDGKKLHVNKTILSYHSDYFKAIFNSDFKEKSMEEIEIKDVNYEDFATLLSLIHINPIAPTKENAEKLLELADRFLIPSIKYHMEAFMITLKINSLEAIRIGEKYGMSALYDHGIKTMASSDWKDLPNKTAYKELSIATKKKLFFSHLGL